MAIWDKVKSELDQAGKVARDAIDEGRVRLDAFRARQQADKAAQALGYSVYRARAGGSDLDADSYTRLSAALASHEKEATLLEAQLASISDKRRTGGASSTGAPPPRSSAPPPPPSDGTAGWNPPPSGGTG